MSIKSKLTSRKFWVALAGLVVGVIALLGIQTDTSQITGVIMALGSVIAYIVGEGLVDAASAGATIVNNVSTAPQKGAAPGSTKDTSPAPTEAQAGAQAVVVIPTTDQAK